MIGVLVSEFVFETVDWIMIQLLTPHLCNVQMKESDAKMAEIQRNMDMIEERLAKLDAEKEELSQYYQLDKYVPGSPIHS